LWGANFYPWNPQEKRIEYTALINIRPKADNPRMEINDQKIGQKVKTICEKLLLGQDERLV
jgi:hypothetical protein